MAKGTDDVNDLIASLDSNEETEVSKHSNPRDAFAHSLYSFVQNRLQAIQKQETFRDVVMESLIDKVKDQEVNISDLLRLYELISKQNRDSTTSLLNMFKGDGQPGSSLFEQKASGAEEEEDSDFSQLSSDERNAIHKLTRVLESSKTSE